MELVSLVKLGAAPGCTSSELSKKSCEGKSYEVHFFDRTSFFAKKTVFPQEEIHTHILALYHKHVRQSDSIVGLTLTYHEHLKLAEGLHHTHQWTDPRIPHAAHHRPPAGPPLQLGQG